jgi:pimeloyl-ACP methyl ester carboxylesterase
MQEHWLQGAHGSIRCQASTQQHGLPLLLIHGYGAPLEHWNRVLPLLQAQHTPYMFDLYNFGFSAGLNTTPRKEIWSAQAAHVIQQLIGQPVVAVGHSMGGMVAAQLAYEYPHLVRALVLVNSAGQSITSPIAPFQQNLFGLKLETALLPGMGQLLQGFEQATGSWVMQQSLRTSYYRQDRITPDLVEAFSAPLRKPGRLEEYMAVLNEGERLVLDFPPGAVQQPSLIIWGGADYAMPPVMATTFRWSLLPEAELHIIPQTGHSPFDEDPHAFCEVLQPWLAKQTTGAG